MLRETKTSICNKALLLLGEEPIGALDDITLKAARVCSEFYSLSINSVFEEGKWPFATIEKELSPLLLPDYSAEQPLVFEIPCDSAIVVRVYQKSDRKSLNRHLDWDIRYIPELQNSAIICSGQKPQENEETPEDEKFYIEYISENVCSKPYSAAFVKCIVAQLAADICMPITHDQQRWVGMLQYATQMKTQALQQSLNEDGQDKMHWIDPFTLSRR